jgi:hypothetical protein
MTTTNQLSNAQINLIDAIIANNGYDNWVKIRSEERETAASLVQSGLIEVRYNNDGDIHLARKLICSLPYPQLSESQTRIINNVETYSQDIYDGWIVIHEVEREDAAYLERMGLLQVCRDNRGNIYKVR